MPILLVSAHVSPGEDPFPNEFQRMPWETWVATLELACEEGFQYVWGDPACDLVHGEGTEVDEWSAGRLDDCLYDARENPRLKFIAELATDPRSSEAHRLLGERMAYLLEKAGTIDMGVCAAGFRVYVE
jgi:hypothetical protein